MNLQEIIHPAKEIHKEYCKTLFEIFDDVSKETPNVVFTIIS